MIFQKGIRANGNSGFLNGTFQSVSKEELFALAKQGSIEPDTPITVNGVESVAMKAKGIEFGLPTAGGGGMAFSPVAPAPASVPPMAPDSVSTGQRFCSNCGQAVGAGAFCPSCGTSIGGQAVKTPGTLNKQGMSSCPDCEGAISKTATLCPHCGKQLSKSKVVAVVISIFFPGLGQIYQRRFFLGIVIFGLWLLLCGGVYYMAVYGRGGPDPNAMGMITFFHWLLALPAIVMAIVCPHRNL